MAGESLCGDEVIVDRLPAGEDVDLCIGSVRTEDLRCGFRIGLGNVAAVEDIDKFLTACGDLIRHLREKLGDVAAGAEKRAADEAEIVALVDLKAVKSELRAA